MNYKIKDLPLDERPREKLKLKGASSLSDEELLAILLRCGTKDASAKDLAIDLLKRIKSITHLQDITYNYLISLKGIKEAKALTILASLELGKRLTLESERVTKITNSLDVYHLLEYEILNLKQEKLFCIYLNTQNEVITYQTIFIGTQNKSLTHPRDIYYSAIKQNAVKIIIAHNHPTNNCLPSKEDIAFTKNLKKVGELVQIPLIDHVILGYNNHFSFLENDIL